jgi:hypothetical protein
MPRSVELQAIDQRIAIARANLRELTEMAAAISGGENESLSAERIARQEELLAKLLKEREALEK